MSQMVEFVGVLFEDAKGRFALQLREQDRKLNPDLWSVFGGHIEKNEEPLHAAIREMKEELSVDLEGNKLKYLGRFERENHTFHIFHCHIFRELDHAVLREGRSWRWCSPEEIQEGVVNGKKIVRYHAQFLLQFLAGRS